MHYIEKFESVKIELDARTSFKAVWRRLFSTSLFSAKYEILYLLIHDKIPTKERMFRIRLLMILTVCYSLIHLVNLRWLIEIVIDQYF